MCRLNQRTDHQLQHCFKTRSSCTTIPEIFLFEIATRQTLHHPTTQQHLTTHITTNCKEDNFHQPVLLLPIKLRSIWLQFIQRHVCHVCSSIQPQVLNAILILCSQLSMSCRCQFITYMWLYMYEQHICMYKGKLLNKGHFRKVLRVLCEKFV